MKFGIREPTVHSDRCAVPFRARFRTGSPIHRPTRRPIDRISRSTAQPKKMPERVRMATRRNSYPNSTENNLPNGSANQSRPSTPPHLCPVVLSPPPARNRNGRLDSLVPSTMLTPYTICIIIPELMRSAPRTAINPRPDAQILRLSPSFSGGKRTRKHAQGEPFRHANLTSAPNSVNPVLQFFSSWQGFQGFPRPSRQQRMTSKPIPISLNS